MGINQLEHMNDILKHRIAVNNKKLFRLRVANTAKLKRSNIKNTVRMHKDISFRTIYNILEANEYCDNDWFAINNENIVYLQRIGISNIKDHSNYLREIVSNRLNVKFNSDTGLIRLNYGVARGETKEFIDDYLVKKHGGNHGSVYDFIVRHKFEPHFDLRNSIYAGLIEHTGVDISYKYLGNNRLWETSDMNRFTVYERKCI